MELCKFPFRDPQKFIARVSNRMREIALCWDGVSDGLHVKHYFKWFKGNFKDHSSTLWNITCSLFSWFTILQSNWTFYYYKRGLDLCEVKLWIIICQISCYYSFQTFDDVTIWDILNLMVCRWAKGLILINWSKS